MPLFQPNQSGGIGHPGGSVEVDAEVVATKTPTVAKARTRSKAKPKPPVEATEEPQSDASV